MVLVSKWLFIKTWQIEIDLPHYPERFSINSASKDSTVILNNLKNFAIKKDIKIPVVPKFSAFYLINFRFTLLVLLIVIERQIS